MFNFMKNKNFGEMVHKDRNNFITPSFRLICDLNSVIDNTESNPNRNLHNLLNFNFTMSEMYLEKDLLIILSENGNIFLVDVVASNLGIKGSVKLISQFSYNTRVAKSIAINRLNNSLLIVYLTRESMTAELKCCSVDIGECKEFVCLNENIKVESDLHFTHLFNSETLSSPAFVEFDDNNNKIITRNSLGTYKIWNLKDYKLIFELSDRRIEEIRTAEEILITIRSVDSNDRLLISIYDIEIGKVVINYEILLFPQLELEILEIFDTVLLMKQSTNSPIVVDLISYESNTIKNVNLDEKSLFMYLSNMKMFISLNDNTLIFYSLKGEQLRSIKNEKVGSINPNFIHMSHDKKYLIIYWEERQVKNIKKINIENKKNSCIYNEKYSGQDVSLINCLKTPKSSGLNTAVNNNLCQNNLTKTKTNKKFPVTPDSEKFSITSSAFKVRNNINNNINNINSVSNTNYYLTSNKCNSNSALGKMIDSDISKISFASEKYSEDLIPDFGSQIKTPQHKTQQKGQEFFKGEFELINLQEDALNSKLFINSDNSKLLGFPFEVTNDIFLNLEQVEDEKISYFTFSQKTLRLYCVTQSGKLFECSI